MGWTAVVPKKSESSGKDRWLPEEDGVRPAVLVGLIDLGTQRERGYGGKDDEDVHKILLCWEIVGEKEPGTTNPVVLGKDYRYSLHEKANLGKLISKWRGKPLQEGEQFDLSKLLGVPCLVDVKKKTAKESGNDYAAITDVTAWSGPMVRGQPKPAPTIKPVSWTFSDGPYPNWSWVPWTLGEPTDELIANAPESKGGEAQQREAAGGETENDDIPF